MKTFISEAPCAIAPLRLERKFTDRWERALQPSARKSGRACSAPPPAHWSIRETSASHSRRKMIGVVLRIFLLMQSGNRIGNKIHIHDVNFVGGTKRQAPAVPPEIQTPSPCRTAWFRRDGCRPERCWAEKWSLAFPAAAAASCARRIFSCAHRDRSRSDPNRSSCLRVTTSFCRLPATATVLTWLKRRKPVVMIAAPRQLQHFQRAAQIYIQAAFFGFPVQRGGTMNHGIGRVHQPVIIIASQTKTGVGQIAAKNAHPRLQKFVERGKSRCNCSALPQAQLRPLAESRARTSTFSDAPCSSSRLAATCAPMYPVDPVRKIATLTPSGPGFRFQVNSRVCRLRDRHLASCKTRAAGRASSGRPSING